MAPRDERPALLEENEAKITEQKNIIEEINEIKIRTSILEKFKRRHECKTRATPSTSRSHARSRVSRNNLLVHPYAARRQVNDVTDTQQTQPAVSMSEPAPPIQQSALAGTEATSFFAANFRPELQDNLTQDGASSSPLSAFEISSICSQPYPDNPFTSARNPRPLISYGCGNSTSTNTTNANTRISRDSLRIENPPLFDFWDNDPFS